MLFSEIASRFIPEGTQKNQKMTKTNEKMDVSIKK
jgi:hypothetical protein